MLIRSKFLNVSAFCFFREWCLSLLFPFLFYRGHQHGRDLFQRCFHCRKGVRPRLFSITNSFTNRKGLQRMLTFELTMGCLGARSSKLSWRGGTDSCFIGAPRTRSLLHNSKTTPRHDQRQWTPKDYNEAFTGDSRIQLRLVCDECGSTQHSRHELSRGFCLPEWALLL